MDDSIDNSLNIDLDQNLKNLSKVYKINLKVILFGPDFLRKTMS